MSFTKTSTKTQSSGFSIPAVGFGVYETNPEETTTIVYEALKAGYRHIDTAQYYENEKESVAGILKWISEDPTNNKRSDIFYTTKLIVTSLEYEKAKVKIAESIELAKGIEYIDLFLIHAPWGDKAQRLGAYKALQESVEAGKVKSIGVSNYGIHHLEELLKWDGLKIKPTINQMELTPWIQRNDLVKYSKEKNILLEAYSPLTRGKKFNDPKLVEISKKYNKSPAQILIRWSLEKGFITLPKTATVSRLAENLDVFDFQLTKFEIDTLGDPEAHEVTVWDPSANPLEY